MKHLKVFLSFFENNKIKIAALILIMVSAIIIISTTIGQYRYNQYTTSFFEKEELKNSLCVQTNITNQLGFETDDSDISNNGIDSLIQQSGKKTFGEDVFKKLYEFAAVKDVYSSFSIYANYNKTDTYLTLASKETYDVFDYRLSSGCWFSKCEQSSEYPNAVLCGNIYENVKVGSDIDIQLFDNNTITVHVIGKVQAPYYTFSFKSNSSDAEGFAGSTKKAITSTRIFLVNDDVTKRALSKFSQKIEDVYTEYSSLFVTLKKDASQQEIKEFKDYLSNSGKSPSAYFDTNELVEYMHKIDADSLKASLPLSLFYIIIATFTLMCVSVIIVKRKLSEHYTFYLCGCSRIKSFMIMLCGILSVSCLSAIIASIYLFLTNCLVASGNNPYASIFIDGYSYLYIWIYAITASLMSLIIPFFTFRKNTPIELYRKREAGI
ncbi:MAG: hypothetical protein PUG48_06530 [Clostridia bacterium]|nr:hypothetical protein [Clostridia bacterium]